MTTIKPISTMTFAALLAVSTSLFSATASAGFFINDAVAADDHDHADHGSKGNGKKSQGSGEKGKAGQQLRKGKKSVVDILADEGEDSDRPAWAGVPGKAGKPGGGNAGGDTKKGGDYGDIVVMLRNDDGTLVVDGNTTYAVASDGSLIPIVDGEIPEGADVQAVEFGRLNVARAPAKVLEHSLVEALSKLDGGVVGDTITLDASGRLVTADGTAIDSPLENLALYEALLKATVTSDGTVVLTATSSSDGGSTTYTLTVPADLRLDLAASAIAAASDKTGELTIDEIVGISSFIGVDDELANLVTSYTYDRQTTYDGVMTWVLIYDEANGVYVPTEVNVYDSVNFNTVDSTSIKNNTTGGIDLFTQSADDAVQVLEYVHDNGLDQ